MADNARLEYLEGRVEEQSRNWDRLFEQLGGLDRKIENCRAELSARIDSVRTELSGRLDTMDLKIDRLQADVINQVAGLAEKITRKADQDVVQSQFRALDAKITDQFKWVIGINVTMWALTVTITVSVILVGLEKILPR